MAALTPAQKKGLKILGDGSEYSPREFARAMWPDSKAWDKRTRGSGSSNRAGAVGGTMPMNGARLLWKLYDLGLVTKLSHNGWIISSRGRERLTEPANA